jgi:uncharacterized membrane protein YgcG
MGISRIHSTLIALVVSAAFTTGLYATVHTVRLGQKTAVPTISAHDLAARQAKLASWRNSLDAALAQRPPALPKKPHFAPVHVTPQAPSSYVAAPTPVTYVHAPTVVKYKQAPTTTTTTTTTTSTSEDDSGDDSGGDDSGGDDSGGDDSGGGD